MKTKQFKWKIQYNGMDIGKMFYTKKECKDHWQDLWNRNLYGYTISKIQCFLLFIFRVSKSF